MTYSTICAVLHDPAHPPTALEAAIAFARRHEAHLHVLCVGLDQSDPGYYYAGAQAIAVQHNLEQAQGQAAALEAAALARLMPETIDWDVQPVTVLPGGLTATLSDMMRFFDLAVLRMPYQAQSDDTDRQIFETCLFKAGVPVLMIPDGAKADCAFGRILVGWDDGQQALASVRAARPLLARAQLTEITIVDPPAHGRDRSDPGGRIATYLARSDTRADIAVLSRKLPSVAQQLSHCAMERHMDLIVMGAYGHSPLREAILGGATRDMLGAASLPVLMAH